MSSSADKSVTIPAADNASIRTGWLVYLSDEHNDAKHGTVWHKANRQYARYTLGDTLALLGEIRDSLCPAQFSEKSVDELIANVQKNTRGSYCFFVNGNNHFEIRTMRCSMESTWKVAGDWDGVDKQVEEIDD